MNFTPAQVGVGVWLGACSFALACGGVAERLVGAMLLADLAAVYLLPGLSPGDDIHWWTILWDALVLAAMLVVQARWRRRWLLVAIGFQVVALLAHTPRLLDPGVHRWAYIAVTTYSGYAVVLALVVGTLMTLPTRGSANDRQRRR